MNNGILRVGGQLSRTAIPMESKYPTILPKNKLISKLVLTDIHKRLGHAGRNHMTSRLRQRYWISGANSLARVSPDNLHLHPLV